MAGDRDITRALGIRELRKSFLRYARGAYQRLPDLQRPRILDIGCGWGTATLELATLSDGEIVGIDVDGSALDELRGEVERLSLVERVSVVRRSFLEPGFADESFDLLWDEGALHLLEAPAALAECRRLLVPGGFLVSCETLKWLDSVERTLDRVGFEIVERVPWEQGCWWREYYAPLEERVTKLREQPGRDLEPLARFEAEIAAVKRDLAATDCAHWVMRRRS